MKRRAFCELGLASIAILPSTAIADISVEKSVSFSSIGEVLRQDLSREALGALRALLPDWRPGTPARLQAHSKMIAGDFRSDRTLSVRGVQMSQTEAALILQQTEGLA